MSGYKSRDRAISPVAVLITLIGILLAIVLFAFGSRNLQAEGVTVNLEAIEALQEQDRPASP